MNRVLLKSLLPILLTSSLAFAGPLPFDKSEYAARRTRFMAQIPDGIAVIRGSLTGPQDNDFKYLCDTFATFPDENLGVRVENTVLITEKGCEILNPGIPREIEEIQALMQSKTVATEQL